MQSPFLDDLPQPSSPSSYSLWSWSSASNASCSSRTSSVASASSATRSPSEDRCGAVMDSTLGSSPQTFCATSSFSSSRTSPVAPVASTSYSTIISGGNPVGESRASHSAPTTSSFSSSLNPHAHHIPDFALVPSALSFDQQNRPLHSFSRAPSTSSTTSASEFDAEEEEDQPPPNFSEVVPGVYRSSFPKSQHYNFLKTLGLKSVL